MIHNEMIQKSQQVNTPPYINVMGAQHSTHVDFVDLNNVNDYISIYNMLTFMLTSC